MTPAPARQIRAAVKTALSEDLSRGDVTTAALFPGPIRARGTIVAHQAITVAGVAVAKQTFHAVDAQLKVIRAARDGSNVRRNHTVLVIEGDARSLLKAERVALNFLQRLSGIATLTAKYCKAVQGRRVKILDTRKTTPGLRALEKYAVAVGGAHNHRFGLDDGVLIKDNHIALAGGVRRAIELARAEVHHLMKIEVEVASHSQLIEAIEARADVIMLDNMNVEDMRESVRIVRDRAPECIIEASGGVSLETVRQIAETGVDLISVGALTHSATAVDISLKMMPL
jgi:nicotinate-nucleotide pyrophosphorylase (carboxylating)